MSASWRKGLGTLAGMGERGLIPGVVTETVRSGNRFPSLDRRQELHELITRYAGGSAHPAHI